MYFFPLNVDCNRKNFPIWCSNIQNVALYKNYNTKLYVVVIDMTLSEKTATGKTKSFCKTVENDYSALNCHQYEHLKFFHNMLFAIQYHMKVTNYFWLKVFFSDLSLALMLLISIKKHTIFKTPFVK